VTTLVSNNITPHVVDSTVALPDVDSTVRLSRVVYPCVFGVKKRKAQVLYVLLHEITH